MAGDWAKIKRKCNSESIRDTLCQWDSSSWAASPGPPKELSGASYIWCRCTQRDFVISRERSDREIFVLIRQ
jgi:hypothetical protein